MIKCYCISLKENEKIRSLLTPQLKKNGINAEYHIVERSPLGGCHGCFTSHIEVLKKGLEQSCQYIMVLEDDVYFECNQDKLNQIYQFIEKLDNQSNWCFSFGYLTACSSTKINHFINQLYHCYCTHAYIVPRQTAKKLSQMVWKNVPIDFQWKEEIDTFYVPYPMIAFQRDHLSAAESSNFIYHCGFKNLARLSEMWSCFPYDLMTLSIVLFIVFVIILFYYK
ncbi:MAG TPA: glycosyltransferase family 25 protein [Candidatus Saccharimonadales bacterium]|nr:glycosyltransferase family 25 protein [Candidatus Saccharimonadales bacterium]